MNSRQTHSERKEIELHLKHLMGWKGNPSQIRKLVWRLIRDDEAQARDEIRGRWKRTR